MTRLDWTAVGQRFYETGVDRGVLYLDGQDGVAWPGLVSIAESPSGGDPKPFYIDGFKYLNLASAEEFDAKITAYFAPPEFAVCDGLAAVQNGLFATGQPRKSFGLSYRTLIGNDTVGDDYAYKVHLVYNALAAPTDHANSTQKSSTDPDTLSWSISTMAPAQNGRKPTAHFIVDSRYADPIKLGTLENLLYGTATDPPGLPTVDSLVNLFTSP